MRWFIAVFALASGPASADSKERSQVSIARVVAVRNGAFRACYDTARKRAPKLAGTFVYTIAIAADGRVRKTAAKAPTNASAALDRCVAKGLRKLAFGAGPAVTIEYPFVFDPAGDVDPALVEMFEAAVAHGNAGEHQEALAAYRALLERQRTQKLAVIPRFTSLVHLQMSYALIDLGKLAEAERELALVDLSALYKPRQYDYHFTLGNVLGGVGKLKPMFSEFVAAASLAEELGSADRATKSWSKALQFIVAKGDWAYVKEVSEKALQIARQRGYKDVETQAAVALSEATRHLEKK
jgi:tetratricopeptide (TPR) repeat protein